MGFIFLAVQKEEPTCEKQRGDTTACVGVCDQTPFCRLT